MQPKMQNTNTVIANSVYIYLILNSIYTTYLVGLILYAEIGSRAIVVMSVIQFALISLSLVAGNTYYRKNNQGGSNISH